MECNAQYVDREGIRSCRVVSDCLLEHLAWTTVILDEPPRSSCPELLAGPLVGVDVGNGEESSRSHAFLNVALAETRQQ